MVSSREKCTPWHCRCEAREAGDWAGGWRGNRAEKRVEEKCGSEQVDGSRIRDTPGHSGTEAVRGSVKNEGHPPVSTGNVSLVYLLFAVIRRKLRKHLEARAASGTKPCRQAAGQKALAKIRHQGARPVRSMPTHFPL